MGSETGSLPKPLRNHPISAQSQSARSAGFPVVKPNPDPGVALAMQKVESSNLFSRFVVMGRGTGLLGRRAAVLPPEPLPQPVPRPGGGDREVVEVVVD